MARAEVEEERAKAACNRQDLSSAMVNIRHQETLIETLRSVSVRLKYRIRSGQILSSFIKPAMRLCIA